MAMVSIALNPESGDVMGFLLGYKKPEKPRKMGFDIGLYIYIKPSILGNLHMGSTSDFSLDGHITTRKNKKKTKYGTI